MRYKRCLHGLHFSSDWDQLGIEARVCNKQIVDESVIFSQIVVAKIMYKT